MDSGNHPSIITQVTRDSERAKYEAELQSGVTIGVNSPVTQVNDNATSETLFSPLPKATEGGAVASNKKDENEQSQTGAKSQPGKAKSLFCCFKLCKRPVNKQNDRANKSSGTKYKTPNGSSQADFGAQHENARAAARSNGEHYGDGTKPPNGAASYGNAHTIQLLSPLAPGQPVRRCVVVDLDETLVHSSFKPVEKPDLTVDVEIDDQVHQVYVLKRPFADEFLERLGQLFECVLFTASLSKYADPVTNWLDNREQKVFSARLFRDACVLHKGNYVKDLSRLGRPLDSVVIIDNSPASYCFHPQNAVPVKSWFDDPSDRELLDLIPLFERLATCEDIYAVLAQHHAERQSQHAQEMALMRLYPLAFATVHNPAAPGVVQLPPYHLVAGSPQPASPGYVALPFAQLAVSSVQPPASTSDPAHSHDAPPVQSEVPPIISSANPPADLNAHNSSPEPPLMCATSDLAADLATAVPPIADPEVAAAAITAGADVSVTAPQTDEDRSLFSPTPVPPLFITPPTPRLSTTASHSHSASASHTTWSVVTGGNDADASQREAPRQRRNSAGSHKSHRRDSQKRRSARPVSTHPEFGASAVTNSYRKPSDADAASRDGAPS